MADDPHLTRILDTARLRLPGATDFVLQTELMNVIQEFCVVTDAWQDDVCLTLCPGQCEYTIFSPDGNGEIYRLMWVANADPQGPDFTAQSWLPTPETFKTTYDPSAAMKVKLRVSLQPSELGRNQNFPAVPPWFWSDYTRAMQDGLIAAMTAQPAKPYSNAQLAQFYMRSFQRDCSLARARVIHGRTHGGQAWAYPQSFAVRRRKY